MAIVSKEDLIKRLSEKFGDDNSDEVIQLTEDLSDTLNDFDSRINDTEDWKTKFEKNDNMWRKKYKDRFLESSDSGYNENNEQDDDENTNVTFNDLFE
jgi:hypothetical protein